MMLFFLHGQNEISISGIISTSDSLENVPFVYVFSKKSGHGVMSNLNGFFHVVAGENDTLIFHHTQFFPLKIAVRNIVEDKSDIKRIYLKRKIFQLPEVKVMDYTLKPYEKERMDKIIRESKFSFSQSLNSPITAMYYAWSRRGNELRKLAKIYEELLLEEKIREKLSPQDLRRLTGDENIDYDAFRKFCFELRAEDYFLTDNYEFYRKVLDCYKRFKREKY
jgi:hypothetical protein